MKEITKLAVVSATTALLATSVASAQTAPAGDLILGFTSSSATADYVVDLGSLASLISAGGVSHLGGNVDLAQFGAGGAPSIGNMNVGVMFGSSAAQTGDYAGVSQVRAGGNASGTAGTEPAPGTPTSGNFVTQAGTDAASLLLGLPANTAQFSTTIQGDPISAGTFANTLGVTPLQAMPGTTISLDLFETTRLAPVGRGTPASAFTYEGTLDIDFSVPNNPVVDFTSVAAVPEPSTLSLLAGAGLLVLHWRRRQTP
jgi:hypothetical protein